MSSKTAASMGVRGVASVRGVARLKTRARVPARFNACARKPSHQRWSGLYDRDHASETALRSSPFDILILSVSIWSQTAGKLPEILRLLSGKSHIYIIIYYIYFNIYMWVRVGGNSIRKQRFSYGIIMTRNVPVWVFDRGLFLPPYLNITVPG